MKTGPLIGVVLGAALALGGCSTTGVQTAQGKAPLVPYEAFEKGEVRLNCVWSCAGAAGQARNRQRAFLARGDWKSLAMETAQIGFDEDLSYFYLGQAAELLGLPEAAKTYYRLSLEAKVTCGRRGPYNLLGINNCDGLVFPADAQARLEGIWASEVATAQKARTLPSTADRPLRQSPADSIAKDASPPAAETLVEPKSPKTVSPPLSARTAPTRVASTGSGFVVASTSIVTNHHVIEDCAALSIRFGSTVLPATISADAAHSDLALLKLSQPLGSPPAVRATAALGEDVTVAGYPLAGLLSSDLVVTSGHVNSTAGLGNDPTMLQISAPVQPGNSGGPLLDRAGSVVGIIVSKLNVERLAKLTGDLAQNVNFAIKPEVLRLFLDANQVQYRTALLGQRLDGIVLAQRARQFTVQVLCEK